MRSTIRFPLIFATAVAVLVAGLLISAYNERAYRLDRARDVGAQADILAASVAAALAFDDAAAAQEYVNALRANPEIEAAGAYDGQGRLVASFARQGVLPGRAPALAPPMVDQTRITVAVPVAQKGASLGAVYLRAVIEPVGRRIARYAGLMLLVAMAALVMVGLGLAQLALTRANTQLRERAVELARANRLLQEQVQEREKAQEALRQSQKMEAIGRITGGVAHDFNNLLMVASSGLELMERAKDPDRRDALKDGIRQALSRGAELTRQLLAFSRRTPLKSEVVDLRTHIEGMRALLDRSLREDIRVEHRVEPDLWPVEIDPSQFELALLNIAVNARDAMPSGGVITICAENCTLDQGPMKGDFVCLRISDTGAGIPPEVLPHVFEPFFTTKEVGKGTGLGLSQVYGFARSSGGEARIESPPGEGATVRMLIPRSARPVSAPRDLAAAPAAAGSGPGGRVLLVEDDDGVAGVVTQLLAELGYHAVRAPTAAAALSLLQQTQRFDLVFSDLVMPGGMDGIGLAREIARRWPQLPVLLTTGFSEAAAAAAEDGLRLLAKPYSLETLASGIDETLAARRGSGG